MSGLVAPGVGDIAGWVVGMPGPDIDYALCVGRDGDKALLRFQVWQQPGPWHEEWVAVIGASRYGCWKTEHADRIGPALIAEAEKFNAHNGEPKA